MSVILSRPEYVNGETKYINDDMLQPNRNILYTFGSYRHLYNKAIVNIHCGST